MHSYPFNLISQFQIEGNDIDTNDQEYSVENVDPIDLIVWSRFDLMAKWIYIDSKERGIDCLWAYEVYKDNIRAFSAGSFTEPGNPSKNSIDAYITSFDTLIGEIKESGLSRDISLVPLGKNGQIFDGAHRVAASAYYGLSVPVLKLNKNPIMPYDYKYFRSLLMNEVYLGYMAMYYAHLKKTCYMACFWPVADGNLLPSAEEILKEAGPIVFEQNVYLTCRGLRNFMIQIYGHQDWTGKLEDRYCGVNCKVDLCFKDKTPIRTYLFESDSLEKVISVKKRIRDLFGIENHSLHISDNKSESDAMVDLLYNPNSVKYMNSAEPYTYLSFWGKLEEFKRIVKQCGLDINRFIIDSSAVLEACGLRQAEDLDYLTDYEKDEFEINLEGIDRHDSQLKHHSIKLGDMLYNPQNYFCYNGIKFLTIERLIEMKNNRHEKKDCRDIKLGKAFLKRDRQVPIRYRYNTQERIHMYQIKKGEYGRGPITYSEYVKESISNLLFSTKHSLKQLNRLRVIYAKWKRIIWYYVRKKRLRNRDFSIIASNCNGGIVCADLGVKFNSPFVNLFLKSGDFIKVIYDLRGYMSEELRFVRETDPVYGELSYPTAYLRDVKIYFMHYSTEEEAREAWERRKARINWDNLFIMFTDRSGCTQEDLEAFDKAPFRNKVVFTHVAHPEIKSSFYIRGYENAGKVGILSEFENDRFPIKRVIDRFDYVSWLNQGM